jgi:hypothetical protein
MLIAVYRDTTGKITAFIDMDMCRKFIAGNPEAYYMK